MFRCYFLLMWPWVASAVKIPCETKTIRSTPDGKTGEIESFRYPHTSKFSIECTYKFIGEQGERVRLVFEDFDLFQRDSSDENNCGEDEAVLYYSKRASASEGRKGRQEIVKHCGKNKPLPILSDGEDFTLYFKMPHVDYDSTGFKLTYTFLTNYGIDVGEKMGDCTFVFNGTEENSTGTFYSPNYPGYYVPYTRCDYIFYPPTEGQMVRFNFTTFNLLGTDPCTYVDGFDYVRFITENGTEVLYCGNYTEGLIVDILNVTAYTSVTFQTYEDKLLTGGSVQSRDPVGFEATYSFQYPEISFATRRHGAAFPYLTTAAILAMKLAN